MFKKSPLRSKKLIRQKRKILIIRSSIITGAILLIIGLSSWATHIRFLKIKDVRVEGIAALNEQDIKDIAQGDIQGRYFKLYSRSNRLLYPEEQIVSDLMTSFKRIDTVDLNVDRNTLIVSINERKPSYVWCSGQPSRSTDRSCYFVDSNGFIFSQAPIFSGNAYIAFYGLVDSEDPIGSTYLARDTFKGVDMMIEFLDKKGIHPYALLAHANGVYELHLEKGGKIMFKNNQDPASLLNTLDLVASKTEILTKQLENLEYIDLRFGNKLYYKINGDNALQIEN